MRDGNGFLGQVEMARENDLQRELLIEEYRPFIIREAGRVCRRFLEWGRDEELSIALMAFNEAIEAYRREEGYSFQRFARLVIRRRLYDHFRKQKKSNPVHLSDYSKLPAEMDWEQKDREREVEEYGKILQSYELDFDMISASSPRHAKTRESLRRAAVILARRKELMGYLRSSGKLPKGRLSALAGVSPRTLERGRVYIIALSLLLADEKFPCLREYLQDLLGVKEEDE